jgi:hypothetical protein
VGEKELREEPKRANPVVPKKLDTEIVKLTKEYTKQVKSAGEKYGMILDVKVFIEHITST